MSRLNEIVLIIYRDSYFKSIEICVSIAISPKIKVYFNNTIYTSKQIY